MRCSTNGEWASVSAISGMASNSVLTESPDRVSCESSVYRAEARQTGRANDSRDRKRNSGTGWSVESAARL
jgi:hypothetical protein